MRVLATLHVRNERRRRPGFLPQQSRDTLPDTYRRVSRSLAAEKPVEFRSSRYVSHSFPHQRVLDVRIHPHLETSLVIAIVSRRHVMTYVWLSARSSPDLTGAS
jgi:hypothetical protein